MRATLFIFSICLVLSTCANRTPENCADAWTAKPSAPVIPPGAGVNIHFTDAQPGEIKMIAEAGFRWVRMDFIWEATEQQRGVYDFSAYDRLMAALDQNRINALFILDYGNSLYTKDKAVRTEDARQAFARWAVAAAKHFARRGIIWEVFNEPNNQMFWPPQPNVDEYIALALSVGRAFRAEAPNEKLIGPATDFDFPFLEACFKAGLLEYWSAVSVHPYRKDDPETAAADYCRLRKLIQSYSPGKQEVPIISGEWGYSAAWRGMSEDAQAQLLARELLTNVANGIAISIWYDWRNDGVDPNEAEQNLGLVRYAYRAGNDQVFEAKPAYNAAKTFNGLLGGFTFEKCLATNDADDFVLYFARGETQRIVAWTRSPTAHTIKIPIRSGEFAATTCTGASVGKLAAGQNLVAVQLSRCPTYLFPKP
jgi:hypothetical protein